MQKKIFITALLVVLGTNFLLSESQELLGDITKEEILQNQPDWGEIMASYTPDKEALAKLETISHPVEIEVVLGTWCKDSKRHVSEYFKVMDMLDNPNFFTTYIGIPRDKEARAPFIEGKDIQKVTTFIVRVDGQEIGRIIEIPKSSIEQDLLDILKR